jgi:hypothetical protein
LLRWGAKRWLEAIFPSKKRRRLNQYVHVIQVVENFTRAFLIGPNKWTDLSRVGQINMRLG